MCSRLVVRKNALRQQYWQRLRGLLLLPFGLAPPFAGSDSGRSAAWILVAARRFWRLSSRLFAESCARTVLNLSAACVDWGQVSVRRFARIRILL